MTAALTAPATVSTLPTRSRRSRSGRQTHAALTTRQGAFDYTNAPPLDPTVWRRILTHTRLSDPTLNRTWFDRLGPRQLENGVIHVTCDTVAQLHFLSGECQQPFNAAAQAVTNRLSVVMFHCPNLKSAAADSAADAWSTAGTSVPLNPDYSFTDFVVGPTNELAHAAAMAVANDPGKSYNPLFIHGGVGLGKTHLLQAMCQQIMEQNPDAKILFLSCDAFVSQFMATVEAGDLTGFRYHYRNADVLVIDDIHFLKDRERVQEEFFHTFNTLYQQQKQIILSADAPPNEIPELLDRLISRFNWGLVAPIEKPGFDTRVAILRKKARMRDLVLADEVIQYIAGRIDGNIRELEGAIAKLQGMTLLTPRDGRTPIIDLALAHKALGDHGKPTDTKRVTVEAIVDAVVRYYGVKVTDLHSKKRNRSIAFPRQVCMYLARAHTRYSLEEIGGYFGGRDHTTILHGVRQIKSYLENDPKIAGQVKAIEQQLLPA